MAVKKVKKSHYAGKEKKDEPMMENMEKRYKENKKKPRKSHYGKV